MPYYTNQYMPTNYTPYYQREMYQPRPVVGIQGKTIDNIEVVKAIDIPLDGSISYFPLADGSAIVSKQLQQDGTSKIIIYKPAEENKPIKYVTEGDLNTIRQEISSLKEKIKSIAEEKGDALWINLI